MGMALPQVVTSDRASGAQVIDGSLKFNGSSNYLSRTPGSASNKKTWTWSGWFKNSSPLTGTQSFFAAGSNGFTFRISATGAIEAYEYSGGFVFHYVTTALFRDPSAWYHIVLAVNTDDSTASDRIKIYVNGSRITDFVTSTSPSSGATAQVNNTVQHEIGSSSTNTYLSGHLSQVNFIDGQQLDASYFGFTDPLTNTWRPKKYTGDFNVSSSTTAAQTVSLSQTGWAVTSPTPQTNIWDGNTSTVSNGHAGGTIGTVTFTPALTGVTKVELFTQNYVHYLNGSSISTPESTNGGWHTYYDNSGSPITLNSVGNAYSNNTQTVDLMAIRINGHIIDSQTWTLPGVTDTTGTNSFYLPMDGNSPIGEDKSGRGNNWTPVNFGGSLELGNPNVSGARPILNVTQGGTQAGVGVFGSELNQTIAVTVSNASGNNKYYLDGSLTPNLAFTRGSTITFNTGDSSGNGHPFKLSSTNASGSAGTEYTDGVAYYINGSVVSGSDYVSNYSSGAASGFRGIKWTVPHNQSTTYYYCTIHTGMGNNGAFTSTIDETKADPYAWKSVLALPLVGSANDVSNSVNSGSTTKTVTSTNAVASSAASNFYGGSWYFDGSGDYLTVPYAADTFSFGTGDFTIEAYVNMSAVQYTAIISSTSTSINATNHWLLGFSNTANMMSFKIDGSGNSSITSDFSGYYSKWTHVAVSRESGTIRLFFDGIEKASATDTSSLTGDSGNAVKIGQRYTNQDAYSIIGYMQDLRVYNGVAKYTSNFVVPATSPDILPDTPSGVSGGSKLAKVTDGAVHFDGSGDSLSIPDNADFDFGTGDFTVELFTYNDLAQSSNPVLIGATGGWYLQFKTGGTIVEFYTGSTSIQATGLGLEGGWHHIAVTKASNVVKIFIDGILKSTTSNSDTTNLASTLYIGNLNGASLHYLGFISNVRILKGTALYTANFTPPFRTLTNVTNTKLLCCQSNTLAGTAAVVPGASGINAGTPWSEFVTIAEGITGTNYNDDASNWFDGDTSTSASLYSGNMVAPYSPTTVVFTPPSPITVSTGVRVYMGVDRGQTILINGTQTNASVSAGWNDTGFTGTLTSLTLGPTNAGSSSNPSALEIDGVILKNLVLPKGNATATNFNPFTTDINAVRGQETGYCTFNVLRERSAGYNPTFRDGNLFMDGRGDGTGTLSAQSGKFYFEVLIETVTTSGQIYLGVQDAAYAGTERGWSTAQIAAMRDTNTLYGNGNAGSGVTYGAGDLMSFAFDADNNKLYIAKNGVYLNGGVPSQGTGFTHSGISFVGGYTPIVSDSQTGQKYRLNCGQKPFKYAPPDGFQSLNAANVRPETVIVRPDHYVGATIYTGDGGASKSISGLNFGGKPDLVWVKGRSYSISHLLYDSVRGAGSTKSLVPNGTNTEGSAGDNATFGYVSSLDNNGFSLVGGSDVNNGYVNKNTATYVGWCWKAGGNKNTFNVDDVGYASAAAAGLDGGAINPAGASVGTKQGFSIILQSGLTAYADSVSSHGLSQTPNFIISKNKAAAGQWDVYHSGLTSGKRIRLNQTTAEFTPNFSNTDSSMKSVGSSTFTFVANSGSGNDIIHYIWHDVPGLQKFGSYEGNSVADGPFVELGFQPAIIWLKNADDGTNRHWCIVDGTRTSFNKSASAEVLFADDSQVESYANNNYGQFGSKPCVDILSNGFKVREGDTSGVYTQTNRANTIIYCAWAEAPTFNLYGGQSNAR